MINIDNIKYPHINHFYNVEPNIEAFLGRKLFIQKKIDGSNAGFYLDDAGRVQLRSRNNNIADKDMYKWAEQSGQLSKIQELLEYASEWGTEYVLFGELYGKGKSPTRIKTYEVPFFEAFDLYSVKEGGFVPYIRAYQECYHFGIPFVETVKHGVWSTVAHLQSSLEDLIAVAEVEKLEGYVIKSWDYKQAELKLWNVAGLPLMFKHKVDTPRLENIPAVNDTERIMLPTLPDSEVYGAIARVKADRATPNFRSVKDTMPVIAQYVAEECKKHNCIAPRNLMKYYQEVLKDES